MNEFEPTTGRSDATPSPFAAPDAADGVQPTSATRVVEIIQTVLTGLVLAFIFRAFWVEPFIIPTGSMADSLLGAHATRVCPACGWVIDFAPLRTSSPAGAGFECPREIICPNCELRLEIAPETTAPKAGDRILVHKWPYALGGPFRPQRWDVIVFRDPADPELHFIKRLIALPGESIEIIDGDVYIDGRIARKPPAVQSVLWFIVFDQAHLADPAFISGRAPRWVTRDEPPVGEPGWTGTDTRVIRYDALDSARREIHFYPGAGAEYLYDLYGYDRGSSGALVGDVRIVTEVALLAGHGLSRWEIDRAPYRFAAEVRRDGTAQLTMAPSDRPGEEQILHTAAGPALVPGRPTTIEFGHVDYRVYLKIDGRDVLSTTDEDYAPNLMQLRAETRTRPVGLALAAENLRVEFRDLRIDRDVYYTSRSSRVQRAAPGDRFKLHDGEYFVLGDNSPDSHDSREWTEAGPHLPASYRLGTVRADQIVGQAAFVYLPGLLPLNPSGRWFVPDLGRMRFVR